MTKDKSDSEFHDSDVENNEVAANYLRKRQNLVEKRRRDSLKKSFNDLKDILPCFRKRKAQVPKLQILIEAQNYIKKHQNHQEMIDEIRSLEAENRHLEYLLAELEQAELENDEETLFRIHSRPPLKRRRCILEDGNTESEDSPCSIPIYYPVAPSTSSESEENENSDELLDDSFPSSFSSDLELCPGLGEGRSDTEVNALLDLLSEESEETENTHECLDR